MCDSMHACSVVDESGTNETATMGIPATLNLRTGRLGLGIECSTLRIALAAVLDA